tara:strand:- start:2111 stop:2491 length:381 start_codon:yes stop_codon:yes gene_type:complete
MPKNNRSSDAPVSLEGFNQLVGRPAFELPIDAISRINTKRYFVTWDEVTERRRNNPRVVMLRRMICKVLREFGYSLPQIGLAMSRHHGAVMNNIDTLEDMLQYYPEVEAEYRTYKNDVEREISDAQ